MGCGECTACCTMFPVSWLNKKAGATCVHCNKGCEIQGSKPSECGDFDCAYIQSAVDNINLRPDKCGVILEKITDKIFFCLVVNGMQPTLDAYNQTASLMQQGFSVVIKTENSNIGFLINEKHSEAEIKTAFSGKVNGYL